MITHLESEAMVFEAIAHSNSNEGHPVIIYKHSTRCFISKMTWSDIRDYAAQMPENRFFFVDVVGYRSVSQFIASQLGVVHESPQLLKIEKGKCTGAVSHEGVSAATLKAWES